MKTERKVLNTSEVLSSIRDLIVHLHRGNGPQAEVIVTHVADYLKVVMQSPLDPASFDVKRAQQTNFAIDEVRMLLAQEDFPEAANAARDAAREWKQQQG